MIKLSRAELLKIATIALAANTPRSLYKGLLETEVVGRLRTEATQAELSAYFDRLTARARRSEIDIALAYSVLIGVLLNKTQDAVEPPNLERLHWGRVFEKMATAEPTVQSFDVLPSLPKAGVQSSANSSIILPSGLESSWKSNA